MLKLQQVKRKTTLNKGAMKEVYDTTPILVNPAAVISAEPFHDDLIQEVNGSAAKEMSFTSLTYRLGSAVKTITVLGEYNSIVDKMSDRRTLLNG